MGTEYGKYAMYYGGSDKTFHELFSEKNLHENMQNTIKFYRHIEFEPNKKNLKL